MDNITTTMFICRTCLNTANTLEEEDFLELDNMLLDIFNYCTHLDVQAFDGLPQHICGSCVKDLHVSYVFTQKAIESNRKLQLIKKSDDGEFYLKDPLENISDSDEESKKGYEDNGLDNDELVDNATGTTIEHSCEDITIYNDDNKFDDFSLLGPLVSLSPESSKDETDFLVSVESQIFPQGSYKCTLCDKHYFTNAGLQAHMEFHGAKSKHISKVTVTCSRKTRLKKSIKNSEEGQDDDVLTKSKIRPKKLKKTFPCSVCGKQMISASKLRYHMVMHTGEKDYLCQMCPKAYSTIYALKHHMRAHTGERPYECKFCGDRFLRPTTLKSHMRRHTGERPYGCEICGKRFIQHSSMATHMKLNHMDKTISCPYCEKKYARQTDLNVHLLSHSGDKPFACKLCSSRFTRQSNLKKHMNQQHHHQSGEVEKAKRSTFHSSASDKISLIVAGSITTEIGSSTR
uniref:Protein krueppel n=1 Tax=Stomoxys calcitrans TaxID=35570 RepID=A0A1I8Q4Q2_STOCA